MLHIQRNATVVTCSISSAVLGLFIYSFTDSHRIYSVMNKIISDVLQKIM